MVLIGRNKLVISALLLFSSAVLAGTPAGHTDDWNDEFDDNFRTYSERYFGPHFDWKWFKAQAIVESSLNKRAVSSSGAQGLMQILPSTYGDIRREQRYFGELNEPRWNIAAGIYYNRMLYRKWKGVPEQDRLYLSLASYNAGYARIRKAYHKVGSAVPKWDRIKAYVPLETRNYVERIRQLMRKETKPIWVAQLADHFDEVVE